MSASSSLSRERSCTSGRTQSTKTSKTRTSKTSTSKTRTSRTRTSKTSPYSGQYEAGLNDVHIYLAGHNYDTDKPPKPANLLDIQQRLMLPRDSLSPSRFTEEDFEAFDRSTQARSETTVYRVIPYMSADDSHFETEMDVKFQNIQPFNESLTAAKPDLYDGARASSLRKAVLDSLGPLVVPTKNSTDPVAPNFFMEAKSKTGCSDVVEKQACHDGAIGARAMHSLQNYGTDKKVYDGNAYSLSATYHNSGFMQLFATHPTAPVLEGGLPAYHMTRLKAFAMKSDVDAFRQGATYFRNARDMMKEVRDKYIEHANGVADAMLANAPSSHRLTQPSRHSSSTTTTVAGSDTSLDELALGPVPPKRARHAQAVPKSRTPLPRDDLFTPPTTSVESAAGQCEASDNAQKRRMQRTRHSGIRPKRVTTAQRVVKGRSGRSFDHGGKPHEE